MEFLYIPLVAAFFGTVAKNKERFNKHQIIGAQLAKELFAKLVYLSLMEFKWANCSNQIANCPVKVEDIDNAQQI